MLVVLVLILAGVSLAAYSYATYKQSKYMYSGQNTVSVSGKGEIFAKPDIASFSFSVEAEAPDAAAAQKKSADSINTIYAHLKDNGIEEKDIKTSGYALNPKYRWEQGVCTQWNCPQGKQILEGYQVNQTITVKVRDTATAGDLISNVGEKGATNISGLEFTIDDDEKLKREARELAIKDARENAKKLAEDLGQRLGRMVSYYEDQGGPIYPMYDKGMMGMGGDAMSARAEMAPGPSLPSGENTITSNVTIVYELR